MNIKAIGKALTNKVGGAMATPYVKYKESQMRRDDKNYNFLKDYGAKRKSGVTPTEKEQAIYKSFKK